MSEPFIGEVRMFPYGFTPRGWAPCAGQIMSIAQNQALFSLLGTTYGGDGRTTFALPDLRGRTPVSSGTSPLGITVNLGQSAGEEAHTLATSEMPQHVHLAYASGETPTATTPANNVWTAQGANAYGTTPNTTMHPSAIGPAGGSQPHDNMQPYLAVNFCIALVGIYPSRN